jgi:hypothetical protein
MPSIKISSLPVGAADPNAILIINNAGNTQTQRVTAGAIAALSGPVHSVAGRTGAIAITSADISNFNTAVAVVAGTASPVASVNGVTGAVSLNATSIGAALASHSHSTGAITGFNSAVAIVAGTAAPVTSVNGFTGAVSLNATTIGAAPASHSHNSTAVTDFVTAVATGERWATVTISNSVISTVADVYRLTSSTATELRGITSAVRDGSTRATFVNVGVNNVTFVHNHSSDSAAFLCPGGASFSLGQDQWAHGRYDPTSQRWRVVPNCCGGT